MTAKKVQALKRAIEALIMGNELSKKILMEESSRTWGDEKRPEYSLKVWELDDQGKKSGSLYEAGRIISLAETMRNFTSIQTSIYGDDHAPYVQIS